MFVYYLRNLRFNSIVLDFLLNVSKNYQIHIFLKLTFKELNLRSNYYLVNCSFLIPTFTVTQLIGFKNRGLKCKIIFFDNNHNEKSLSIYFNCKSA